MGAIDGDGVAVSYIQSIYWEYGSGVRAAAHRRADAEPRHRLLARSRAAARAEAGAAAVPHAEPRARRLRRRPRDVLRLDGRRRAAAVPGAGVHPHRRRAAARRRRRRAALAVGPHLGRRQRHGEGRGRRYDDAIAAGLAAARPRDRAPAAERGRTCSATPARCGAASRARSRRPTIRAPTAARSGI